MSKTHPFSGVYVAAVTPLNPKLNPDLEAISKLMKFYADNGCHGALILGTTGEGPSFNPTDRSEIMQAAAQIKQTRPDFRLFAGTGTPSQKETIELNQAAFELDYDAVIVLPPYYFRGAGDAGLLSWFCEVIDNSVPKDKYLLGYHIPQVSGVPLKIDMLQEIQSRFPRRFGGVKDSEGSLENTHALANGLTDNKLILVGNDRLMTVGLEAGASGCITALANLISPWLRMIFDQFGQADTNEIQAKVDAARDIMGQFMPFPSSIKYLLSEFSGFPHWPVLPPLVPLAEQDQHSLVSQIKLIIENGKI
jgi:4-hydroxy-tetrahydrodipicolinate synthase